MTYNLTFDSPSLVGFFELTNNIHPMSTAVILLLVPFVIMLIAFSKWGIKISLMTASIIMMIISVILIPTGLIDAMFLPIFLALTIVGFVWNSVGTSI